MIPLEVYNKAFNQSIDVNERGVALLNSIQSKLGDEPSYFSKFVVIMESEPYLRSQAEKLVQSFSE